MILLCPVQGPWASSYFVHFLGKEKTAIIVNFEDLYLPIMLVFHFMFLIYIKDICLVNIYE